MTQKPIRRIENIDPPLIQALKAVVDRLEDIAIELSTLNSILADKD